LKQLCEKLSLVLVKQLGIPASSVNQYLLNMIEKVSSDPLNAVSKQQEPKPSQSATMDAPSRPPTPRREPEAGASLAGRAKSIFELLLQLQKTLPDK
jgi:hypothetical protein